jgi:DNA-binding transcriptional regulator YiaG
MQHKTLDSYTYTGLGFPIFLQQTELVKIDGEWQAKINVRKIADQAIKILATQTERLTGNQVKFIRGYFEMSLRQFAKQVVRESHAAVNKWESFADEVTNMDSNIEIMLRLYIIEQIEAKTIKQKNSFYGKYLQLKNICFSSKKTSQLNIGQALLV